MYKTKKANERGISLVDLILLIVLIVGLIYIANYFINPTKQISISNNKSTNTENDYNVSVFENSNNEIGNNSNSNIIANTNQYRTYFYEQLSNNAKSIYNSIINNIDTLKKGQGRIELEITDEGADSEFQSAWDALCLDRVELFYIDTQKISFVTQTITNIFGKKSYKYYIEPKNNGKYFSEYWNDEYEVQSAINQVENKIYTIISNVESKSRYEQVKYIHDYIIENVEYNQTEAPNNSNMYGALIEGKAVCEGYAESFKYMMDKLNIPCILVYGNGINNAGNSEYHSWNQVLMEDGKWYSVDSTWDDPILIGFGKLPESSKYKYFLKGSNEFAENHKKENDVSGTGQYFEYIETANENYKK